MSSKYAIAETSLRLSPPDYAKPNERGGRLRVLYDKYTLTADLAAADVIYFGKIPKGARVVDVMVKFADLDASGGTIDVGYDGGTNALETSDPDAFMNDADVTTADTFWSSDNLANAPGIGHEMLDEVNITVTTVGDTDATSGDIEVFVLYVLD
jgi:hypothetical protein